MSIALPDWTPPARWPWLKRIVTQRRLLALALMLGLLSVVGVAEMAVECRDKPNYLLSTTGFPIATADGSGRLLLAEQRRTCRLSASVVQRLLTRRIP